MSKPLDEYAFANCDGTGTLGESTVMSSCDVVVGSATTGLVSFPESRRDFDCGGCIGEAIEGGCAGITACDTASGLGAVGVLWSLFCSSGVPEIADEALFVEGGCNIELFAIIGEF